MHIEPFGGGFFAAADLIAHDRIENLGATAGDRPETGFAQRFQCVTDRYPKNSLGQMTNFDRGECFDVKLRIERRSEEHTSELQSQSNLVCRLLLEKKKKMR